MSINSANLTYAGKFSVMKPPFTKMMQLIPYTVLYLNLQGVDTHFSTLSVIYFCTKILITGVIQHFIFARKVRKSRDSLKFVVNPSLMLIFILLLDFISMIILI